MLLMGMTQVLLLTDWKIVVHTSNGRRFMRRQFIMKRTISSDLFEYIIKCKSAQDIWKTLDQLFNKKNEARLQILENELANTTQGNLSILEYLLKIKNL